MKSKWLKFGLFFTSIVIFCTFGIRSEALDLQQNQIPPESNETLSINSDSDTKIHRALVNYDWDALAELTDDESYQMVVIQKYLYLKDYALNQRVELRDYEIAVENWITRQTTLQENETVPDEDTQNAELGEKRVDESTQNDDSVQNSLRQNAFDIIADKLDTDCKDFEEYQAWLQTQTEDDVDAEAQELDKMLDAEIIMDLIDGFGKIKTISTESIDEVSFPETLRAIINGEECHIPVTWEQRVPETIYDVRFGNGYILSHNIRDNVIPYIEVIIAENEEEHRLRSVSRATTASGTWIKGSNGRWWYKHSDGTYTTNGWEKIDDIWYHFDSEGWMDEDKWIDGIYYVDSNGYWRKSIVTTWDNFCIAVSDLTVNTIYVNENLTATSTAATTNNKTLTIVPLAADCYIYMIPSHENGVLLSIENGASLIVNGSSDYGIFFQGNNGNVSIPAGIISVYDKGSVALHSGTYIYNSPTNGVYGDGQTNITISDGVSLFGNLGSGVYSMGNLNITGGKFYDNGNKGLNNGGIHLDPAPGFNTATIKNVECYDNNFGIAINGGTVSIEDSKIYNNNLVSAYGGGGLQIGQTAEITVKNCIFEGNHALGGSAIYNSGNLTLIGGSVKNNTTDQLGAVLNRSIASMTVNGGVIFEGNKAKEGGAIYNDNICYIVDASFSNNSAGDGGAISSRGGQLTIRESTISNNIASKYGAGIYALDDAVIEIHDSKFENNSFAIGDDNWKCGSAIASISANITVDNSAFNNNGVSKPLNCSGGAIWNNTGSTFTITKSSFTGNYATNGGAIYNDPDAILSVDESCSFTANTATSMGGAIRNQGIMNLKNSTFTQNNADYGGGAAVSAVDVVIENTTFEKNESTNGGAIFFAENISAELNNCTINNNTAENGGGLFSLSKSVVITDSIINENNAGYGGGVYGIYAENAENNITLRGSSKVQSNTAGYGGGIWFDGHGKLSLEENAVVTNNQLADATNGYAEGIAVLNSDGLLYMKGNAKVSDDNDVYLYPDTYIVVTSELTNSETLARVTPSEYTLGRTIVKVDYGNKLASTEYFHNDLTRKFELTPKDTYILRPGDYLDNSASIEVSDIVISTYYDIYYKSNTTVTVNNMPEPGNKYWNENVSISSLKPERVGYTFKNWNTKADGTGTAYAANANYTENETLTLYAIWDKKPELIVQNDEVLSFYEGAEVTKEMLLSNIIATDLEDDKNGIPLEIRITKIEYSEGKLIDGKEQPAYTDSWENDMPDDYLLDTWFLQMNKEPGVVTHSITYEVTDSFGNTTVLPWKIKVKYNEYPTIEATDKSFLISEVKDGSLTEEQVLSFAVANDIEDESFGLDINGSLKVLDFDASQFNVGGSVVVTFYIKDSFGKETTKSMTIHVYDENVEALPLQHSEVRFIAKQYYGKSEESGGLNPNSIWYINPDYASTMQNVFANTKDASGRWSSVEQIWKFGTSDVADVKEFIGNNGLGNSKNEDALNNFITRYSDNRTE